MQLQFIKNHPKAILPKKNYTNSLTGDAGLDLFSIEDAIIPARGSKIVNVGLQLGGITPGYWFRIEPRSGLGFKKGLQPHLGIIDNGYRGDLGVKLFNFSDEDQKISEGQGVAQIIVYEMIPTEVSFISKEEAREGARGDKGFGSSDK